uniref:Uncharacterized protein LOC113794414 n=1 Tax=Dermatophagoides pteronyssinus TaxID=6956 RepID=A0A6P6Y4C6_DERPT|nr:uncharacterized protein LOC113794414 [Dermatophagoides pteronyssinus]
MQNHQKWDVVQLYGKNLKPSENSAPNFLCTECDLHFMHLSEFWPVEKWHKILTHNWPTDGSDFVLMIRINQENQYRYKSIRLDEISYIYTVNDRIIRFELNDKHPFEYSMKFTDGSKVRRLLKTIFKEIPCFNWDLIITNPDHDSYCLLNRNHSKLNNSSVDEKPVENEDDDDNDDSIIYIPPKVKRTDGQSTSKSL